jgi:hypothetical protein
MWRCCKIIMFPVWCRKMKLLQHMITLHHLEPSSANVRYKERKKPSDLSPIFVFVLQNAFLAYWTHYRSSCRRMLHDGIFSCLNSCNKVSVKPSSVELFTGINPKKHSFTETSSPIRHAQIE